MSEKLFENFLADQLITWGGDNLKKGYRYQFQSPDAENSERLFNALKQRSSTEVEIKLIKIPVIHVGDVKLLITLHNEDDHSGFSENFISHIRDEVASQQAQLKDCSLLVVHNSMLDTILNSAEDVAQDGAIWHPNQIKLALEDFISGDASKIKVSRSLLKHKFEQIIEDGATMFGFEELFRVINDGDLRFDEIGLLNDPAILKIDVDSEGQINSRLERNKQLYEKIDYITHSFPTNLEEKLGEIDFGPNFVKKYFKDGDIESWRTELELSACEQEQAKNRDNLLELEKETLSSGTLYSRPKAETKAGAREKHLICLLEEAQDTFEITACFLGGKVDATECQLSHSSSENIVISPPDNTGGKRSRVSIKGSYEGQNIFFNFRVKRDKTRENHSFKVLVLRKGEFFEEAFKYCYLVDPKNQEVILQLEENSLQISDLQDKYYLSENGQVVRNDEFGLVDFDEFASESDHIEFSIRGINTTLQYIIEGPAASEALFLPLMLDQEKFFKLYQDDYYAALNKAKTKVQIDNREVAPKGKRLTLLQWERELLDDNCLYLAEYEENSVYIEELNEHYPEISKSYSNLFSYLKDLGTLPSLSGWGPTFKSLVSEVVDSYLEQLEIIQYDTLLTKSEKSLVNIGFANFRNEEYITPFHPMVLAYHLYLADSISDDESGSFKSIPRVTLNRLTARGLIPFVFDPVNDFSYTHSEAENPMWLKLIPQQNTSFDYVRKLVKEKVSEFHEAFNCLFESGERSHIIINSVNNAENRELFLGLIDIVKTQRDKVCLIHVNIYDDEIGPTEFDRFADTHSYDEIKENYGLDKGATKDIADTIIDLIRTRLTFSKFKNKKLEDGTYKTQEYAHLTFFKNNNKVQPTDVNINEEISGVVSNGVLAGEASTSKEGSYFTSFGLKGIDIEDKKHLRIAQRLNGLIKPTRKSNEQHSRSKSLALAVSDKFKQLLACSYKSSIWTTIIDPKVTLDFFDSEKNVVLIHYSDNYTNSVNYDAITVTEESDLYKKVLEQDQGGIIEEYNAFNGEWLLKMITANENDRKEKKGIIGAYKFISCLLHRSDITWIPLSVAEMIRVTGNIGLKMSDSDFSRNVQGYRKGQISDDILFVGFKDESMVLLPVEVKTGKKQTHSKGVTQAKELKRYLVEDILKPLTFVGNIYRGLFIRQILMQIDKYRLYNLYKEDYFDKFLSEREWWLQGNYSIKDIDNYPEGFLVSHVENHSFFEPKLEDSDGIVKVFLPISYLNTFVKTPLGKLVSETQPEKLCHVDKDYILDGETKLLSLASSQLAPLKELPSESEASTVNEDSQIEDVSYNHETSESKVENIPTNESLKVLVGHSTQEDEPVFWEPTNTAKFMNTNSGIIGTMGTGKTQCTKSVITQLHQNQHCNVDGKPIGVLIFDYKSDYVDEAFLSATSGKKFNLHKLPYNPLSLFGDTPMLPVHTARGFSETMGKAFGLGQKQQLRLRKLISDAYELAGIHKADSNTWKRQAPTIADIWSLFIEEEPVEDSLYAALESLHDLEVFEDDIQKCTSLYELVDGITVIELARYPTEIQNLVVALTLDLFYSQMQKQGKPEVRGDFRQVTKLILVDEADNFMSQNFPSLRKILKEGREYGVGVILSTQDITHFKTGENDYSAYILSWIVHRVSQIKNQDIKSIFNKDDRQSQDHLMNSIRELEKHHSLYVDGDKKITKIKDLAFWELVYEK